MTMLRRIVALAILGVVLAGCSVQLRTAPAPMNACEDALGSGRLVANSQSGLAFQDSAGGVTPVLWPFGYAARRGATGVELLDEKGAVIAREGDFVTAGGGTGNDGFFAVCAGSVKVVPAPG
jgi:hypothetical protein